MLQGGARDPVSRYREQDLAWAIGSICGQHQQPFDAGLMLSAIAPPYGEAELVQVARPAGLRASLKSVRVSRLSRVPLPVVVELLPLESDPIGPHGAPAGGAPDEAAGQARSQGGALYLLRAVTGRKSRV